MQQNKVKSDFKLFRELLPEWQEKYMKKLRHDGQWN